MQLISVYFSLSLCSAQIEFRRFSIEPRPRPFQLAWIDFGLPGLPLTWNWNWNSKIVNSPKPLQIVCPIRCARALVELPDCAHWPVAHDDLFAAVSIDCLSLVWWQIPTRDCHYCRHHCRYFHHHYDANLMTVNGLLSTVSALWTMLIPWRSECVCMCGVYDACSCFIFVSRVALLLFGLAFSSLWIGYATAFRLHGRRRHRLMHEIKMKIGLTHYSIECPSECTRDQHQPASRRQQQKRRVEVERKEAHRVRRRHRGRTEKEETK